MHDEIALNYDDITVIPEKITTITSRKECNPYDENGYLPIFASCMSSVVSIDNTKDFNKAKIRTVIPRSYSVDDRLKYLAENFPNTPNFVAFSLNEAKDLFVDNYLLTTVKINKYFTKYLDTNLINVLSDKNKTWKTEFQWPIKICIDLANGHMKKLLDLVKDIKRIHGDNIIIMTGNIANPETYRDYEEAGVDYCRVSVGTGDACFVEGTKITMADGSKVNVEDVDKGDFVKTKNGIYKVTNTIVKKTEETIKINDDIECTPNHKFFVVKKNDVKENIDLTDEEIKKIGFWVEASELTDDYFLVQA